MIPVASRSIRTIGYEDNRRRLIIVFRTGYTYVFWGVPASVYRALMGAASKGRYFNSFIRGKYPSSRAA